MPELSVSAVTVPTLLEKLKKLEWQVPKFQREFVWSTSDVLELLVSIYEARPIGMATLWEQSDPPGVDLQPIYIQDFDPVTNSGTPRYFADNVQPPRTTNAILDGRQRCTALAMAFGGLRALDGRYRFSGRYYLDVLADDDSKRFQFIKESDVNTRRLDVDANCISAGLFPLCSNVAGESIMNQWMRYVAAIQDPQYYSNSTLPFPDHLQRRNEILKKAFQGIVDTKLAVYTVPSNYSLSDICDIFEKLNTTGTKVSAVDLIHSYLYADTKEDAEGPIDLRAWIGDFGQLDGAIGWSSPTDRPELMAQIVTACYVALDQKPRSRNLGGGRQSSVTSVKSGDLMATPTLHWRNVIQNQLRLAEFLLEFQRVVAQGLFSYQDCPYPISAAIYVALRWHLAFDLQPGTPRRTDELDALFRAFFWRNALANRYDQGFLTQLGADIGEIKGWLSLRDSFATITEWAADIQTKMAIYMKAPIPNEETLVDQLTNGRPTGATQKAFYLCMLASVKKDLIDPAISLAFPGGENVEMHHIYPRAWCANNQAGALSSLLNVQQAGRDWANSVSNLMPLSRQSNNLWKARVPGQLLRERSTTYQQVQEICDAAYIDEISFGYLLEGTTHIREFWSRRADAIADDLLRRTNVIV